MKHIVVGTLSLPPIIENGIIGMLDKMRSQTCSVHRMDLANIKEQTSRFRPSIIIVDSACSDIATIQALRASSAKTPVKIIGIQHCALPQDRQSLFDAIISIYDPMAVVESTIIRLSTSEEDENDEEESKSLSQREKDVVIGITKGLSNKEIASQMNVSVNTVMTHRRNISAKLKIHSPAGITIYAIVSKLIKLEDIKTQLPQKE